MYFLLILRFVVDKINMNKDFYHLNLLFKAPDGHDEPKISTINGM